MKILLISTYFHPDVAATGIVMTNLAEELVAHGHHVQVICTAPHYAENRIEEPFRGRLWDSSIENGIKISRLYTYVPGSKLDFLGRLLNYAVFNTLSFLVGNALRDCDLTLVASPPLTNGISADLLSRVKRIPFVYNVQDVWPDVVIRAGQLRNRKVIRIFQKMEKYIYRRAACVTVLSEQMRENLLIKGVPAEKLHVIPTCQNTRFIKPLQKENGFSREHSLGSRFVVLFAGNVGYSQGLETVLEAARLLVGRSKIVFLIVGNGVAKPGLQSYAEERGIRNVTFLPYEPHERVPEVYGSADICLVPLRKGFTIESVPSKVHTIMAAGRPIIASVDSGSATSDLIKEAECGLCVEVESPSAMANAILQLYGDQQLREKLGENGRKFVVQHFTPEIIAKQYDELLRRVLAER